MKTASELTMIPTLTRAPQQIKFEAIKLHPFDAAAFLLCLSVCSHFEWHNVQRLNARFSADWMATVYTEKKERERKHMPQPMGHQCGFCDFDLIRSLLRLTWLINLI